MKRKYDKPTVQVVLLQHRTTLLQSSNWDTIPQGEDNRPAAARGFDGFDDWDE